MASCQRSQAAPGEQKDAIALRPSALKALLPARPAAAHKGTFGQLLVVAGSPQAPGAALLALHGALRSGAGKVRWACCPATLANAHSLRPEVMLAVDTAPQFMRQARLWAESVLQGSSAVLMGPGLGTGAAQKRQLGALLAAGHVPMVLDADALMLLAVERALRRQIVASTQPIVLTPHPKEMARLTKVPIADVLREPVALARGLAKALGVVVVLKSEQTTVASAKGAFRLTGRGEPALARGGTGDVLAGIVGSLLAQGVAPDAAAKAAVLAHRQAGRIVARSGRMGALASDVAEALQAVYKSVGL